MVDCMCAFSWNINDIIGTRRCSELEASRWMCRCLFNIVQYFILQLLCRVTGIVVGVHVSDAYGGVELTVPLSSLTSELDGDEWLASCCDRPVPGKGSR
jgi:hypothetical protein